MSFWHDDFDHDLTRGFGNVPQLKATAEAWISKTAQRGDIPALRACMTNFVTQPKHVDRLVALLARERAVS